MDKKVIIGFIVVIVLILGGIVFVSSKTASVGPDLSVFAQCLKDKGATFYGAFWCPHCQATKRMFGAGASKLPYVECSTPDGNGQTQICIDKGIHQYPTWYFADGSTLTGELTLQQLADKTGCPVPAEAGGSAAPVNTNASTVVSTTTSSASTATTSSSATVSPSPRASISASTGLQLTQ